MFENQNQTLDQCNKNNGSDDKKDAKDKLLEELLKSPFEQVMDAIKKQESKDKETDCTDSTKFMLANHVRMPAKVGPVGPVGRIEDIKL